MLLLLLTYSVTWFWKNGNFCLNTTSKEHFSFTWQSIRTMIMSSHSSHGEEGNISLICIEEKLVRIFRVCFGLLDIFQNKLD